MGAELIGVTGEAVSGVGDLALWFGGAQAEGGGDAGVLSVATQTPLGALVFRIVLGRTDLDSSEQLEVAKTLALSALPRFPGVEVEQPAPPEEVVITIEHAPVDRSRQSFVENLLAREADGEWTRGEGLVATLRYLAGELAAAEVLRHSEVLDGSGTGIVGLAQAYVEADGDANAVAEIERLLDLLLIPDHRATSTAAEASAPGPRVRPIGYRASQEAAKSCIFPYPDLGNPCFRSVRVGSEQFGSKYIFWIPDIAEGEEWQGWTRGPSTIRDAILASAVQLESMSGSMPAVAVWLAPYAGHSIVNLSGGLCGIQLNKGAQALRDRDPKLLQQAVASAIARCYVRWNFGLTGGWRNAIAWYLSDVIYPDASMEVLVLEVPNALAGEELGSTLIDRSLTNMPFFEYVDSARGLEGR